MTHPSSQLNLGVYDHDTASSDSDDFIGRVSIDVTPFRPNTEYTLEYNLYSTARIAKRETNFWTSDGKYVIYSLVIFGKIRVFSLSGLFSINCL